MKKIKYPDCSKLSIEEKDKIIKKHAKMTAKYTLQLFLMLGLKTHIETMIVNDATGEEYIFSFKTVDKYKEDKFK